MEISKYWRLQKQRYGLVGEVCQHCGSKIFPPRGACPNCAPGKTEVYSFDPVVKHTDEEKAVPVAVALLVV